MKDHATPIKSVQPPAPYQGGKRNLARRLVQIIGAIPHDTYVEPFVGMGGVFLRRTARPRAEVINDLSADVTNLFRILQRHHGAFMAELAGQITSRTEFDRLMRIDPSTLTDLERAARFLYLQRLAFGGKIVGRNFGVDRRSPAGFDTAKLGPLLAKVHARLSGVVIERLHYADVIRRYDSPETLFYLDPPYWGCEGDYGMGFGREDFTALAGQLAGISGRFVLSINDTPGVRDAFGRFRFEEAETTYTISTNTTGGGTRAKELIVTGCRT